MNNNRNLTIGTLAANLFILIGAGHGVAPIGFLEAGFTSGHFFNQPVVFNGNYDETLPISIIISLIGQLLLFASLFNTGKLVKIFAIAILWAGFAYLIHNIIKGDGLSWFSFWSGTPFLICSIILFIKTIRAPVADITE